MKLFAQRKLWAGGRLRTRGKLRAGGRLNVPYVVLWMGSAAFALLVVFLILFDKSTDRLCANGKLALFGVLFLFLGGVIFCLAPEGGKAKGRRIGHPVLWILAGYLVLGVLQLLLVRAVYFYTSWDVGGLRESVENLLQGVPLQETGAVHDYSVYPNNLLLFYLFTLIERAGRFFGMEEPYNLCVYLSCVCVDLACFLGQLTVNRLVRTPGVRALYAVVGTVFILFSPWIMIPYSDTYGMLFVALGCFGIVCLRESRIRWFVVAFAGFVGYGIKPSGIFPLFAAWLIYGVSYLFTIRENFREFLRLLTATAVFGIVSVLLPLWIQYACSLPLEPQLRMPYSHWLMMGFNETMKGGYTHDDFLYSQSFPDVESRTEGTLERFLERVEDMADRGTLLYFLKEKALVNFNDGAFAWGEEGGFFLWQVEHDNRLYSLFLRAAVPEGTWGSDGAYFALHKTVRQGIWLAVLLGIAFAALEGREHTREKACLMTAVCGLFLFVMLFEARARYLFLYTPVFLALSVCGCDALWRRAREAFLRVSSKEDKGEKESVRLEA